MRRLLSGSTLGILALACTSTSNVEVDGTGGDAGTRNSGGAGAGGEDGAEGPGGKGGHDPGAGGVAGSSGSGHHAGAGSRSIGSNGGSAGDEGSVSDGGSAGGGSISALPCADFLVSPGTSPRAASTTGASDAFQLSCASGTAPDVAYEWTAPAAGYYTISTVGSDFDTVLGVVEDCEGTEIACSDNYESLPTSELVQYFEAQQRALLVVDGKSGATGNVALSVAPVACPAQDISGQSLPISLTTVGGTNSQAGACGGAGRRERTLRWTAPSDALYRFAVTSEALSPALHLERGARCGGELLQCLAANPSAITRFVREDEPVVLIVDSTAGEGSFDLDITTVGGRCPQFDAITYNIPFVLTQTDPDVLSGSCSPPHATTTGEWPGFAEHSHGFSIDLSGIALQTLIVAGDAEFSAYLVRGGACGGEEVSCQIATGGGSSWGTSFSFLAADNGDYVLVIESAETLTYTLTATLVA